MSVMVLLVLAVVWVVALTPMVMRKLSERHVLGSVASFNRQLGYLRSRSGGFGSAGFGSGGYGRRILALAPIGFSAAAERIHERRSYAGFGGAEKFDAGVRPAPVNEIEAAPVLAPSRATVVRRRRVVVCLVGGTLLCALFGIVPALAFFWYLALVGVVFGAVYLGLFVYFRRLALERAQKVVALETRRQVLSALEEARVVSAAAGAAAAGTGAAWAITGSHRGGTPGSTAAPAFAPPSGAAARSGGTRVGGTRVGGTRSGSTMREGGTSGQVNPLAAAAGGVAAAAVPSAFPAAPAIRSARPPSAIGDPADSVRFAGLARRR